MKAESIAIVAGLYVIWLVLFGVVGAMAWQSVGGKTWVGFAVGALAGPGWIAFIYIWRARGKQNVGKDQPT